jgi:signal transduction histidine kinase
VEDLSIACDMDQMTQILVNLLANGLQAAGEQGRVGVQWIDGTDPCLVVWDDGPGFEGEPSALFAPWYTTKEKGTGLGLAITHRLVRAHGWQIEARREDDRTELVVRLNHEDVTVGTSSAKTTHPPGAGSREDPHRRRSA